MKNLPVIITALIFVVLSFSCLGGSTVVLEKPDVVTVIYDGCEYVKFGYAESNWGSHKGNCSNTIHNQR